MLEVDTGSDLSCVQCKPGARGVVVLQKEGPALRPFPSPRRTPPCCAAGPRARGWASTRPGAWRRRRARSAGTWSATATGPTQRACTVQLRHADADGDGRGGAVLGFLFGCGHAQSGLFTGIDGLLGLGRLPVSLVGQAAGAYGGAFSYCFPTKPSTLGYLTLGGGANAAAPGVRDDAAAARDSTVIRPCCSAILYGSQFFRSNISCHLSYCLSFLFCYL
ncbi:hypothetical protein SEVIR_7G296633v4 [Setaria viridis]|uniref:Xylanase inhibitor N-terminal domain-containing protein n=1 Tax=Setaria viridis TaxID=4556 RepID=A0A4U6U1W1_SETVI|nr:hypothetical protein SEVIR_7G296633v2 [Setaria viridis]